MALFKTAQIVPQRSAYIIERLGRYARTLDAGFHILIPFIDRVAYRQTLKEEAIDVPKQQCIARDNISVSVDGLYLQVVDPHAGRSLFAPFTPGPHSLRSRIVLAP